MLLGPKMGPPYGSCVLQRHIWENMKKSSPLKPQSRALIFDMWHHIADLYHVCSNYATVAKMARPGSHIVYTGLYWGKREKPSCRA